MCVPGVRIRSRFRQKIDAIDLHIHIEIDSHGHKAYDDEPVDATRSYFKMTSDAASTIDDLAQQYRGRNAVAVMFTIEAESGPGQPSNSVEELAPARRAITTCSSLEPSDRRSYPIYQAVANAGVPALFHTGQTCIGSGLPGGHGSKLRYSDLMLLDDVSVDFPGSPW